MPEDYFHCLAPAPGPGVCSTERVCVWGGMCVCVCVRGYVWGVWGCGECVAVGVCVCVHVGGCGCVCTLTGEREGMCKGTSHHT